MAFNPNMLFKVKGLADQFQNNHPKMINFFRVVFANGVEEGTILEVTVKRPGEEPMTANMKVTASDMELIRELQNLNMN